MKRVIKSSQYDQVDRLRDSYLEPVDDEYTELPEVEEHIEVELDDIITIDRDGSWEYANRDYPWAQPDAENNKRNWYSDEYSNLYIDDYVGVVEKVDDLLMNKLPSEPGKYKVKADIDLYYSIIGLVEDQDGDVYTDDADILYVQDESSIDNFSCEPVTR